MLLESSEHDSLPHALLGDERALHGEAQDPVTERVRDLSHDVMVTSVVLVLHPLVLCELLENAQWLPRA